MVSDSVFQKAVALLNKADSILITTHTRLDGDACGSAVAMREVLTSLGKEVEIVLLSEIPQWYESLFADKPAVLGLDISLEKLKTGKPIDLDLIVIVDTNSRSQLPKFEEYLKDNSKPVLVIDHHVTADGLGSVELTDTSASATGIIVHELLEYAGWPVTKSVANALFIAIATDTGWFQFSNTDSRTFRVVSELIDAGVDPTKVYQGLYQNYSAERFRLMVAMLDTLELHFGGRFAAQHITLADFERTGASPKDTENLIDECRRIGTVEAAALFIETSDGRIRCSLRSKGAVDVSEIARKFGGGGHKMASGTYLPGPLDHAKQLIVAEFERRLA